MSCFTCALTDRCFIGSTIFLSEWIPGAINTIDAWWLQDAISSIRWRTLNDRQTAVLFDESDGSGNQYNNIKGWGSVKEIANLDDFGIADSISAFRWNAINPMKEIIAPFIVTPNNVAGNFGVTASHEQNNDTPVRQSFTLSIDKEDAQEVTTSTTDTHVAGITATWTSSVEAGVEAVGKTKTECEYAVKQTPLLTYLRLLLTVSLGQKGRWPSSTNIPILLRPRQARDRPSLCTLPGLSKLHHSRK